MHIQRPLTPIQRFSLTTGDPDVAYQAIRDTFGSGRVTVTGVRPGFRYRQVTAVAGDLAIDEVDHTMGVQTSGDPFEYTVIVLIRSGHVRMSTCREEIRVGPGDVFVGPDLMAYQNESTGIKALTVRLPLHDLRHRAEAQTGVVPTPFRFDAMRPSALAMNQHWHLTMLHLHRLFADPEPLVSSPLILATAMEAATLSALAAFPNSANSSSYYVGMRGVASASIRRAVAFVDDHAHDPITMSDIAVAAGIEPRGLQVGFGRYLDTTPTGYLRRVRMERAHRDLLLADPAAGDTVCDIARRWGFVHVGRFAVQYRKIYGRSPSQTLQT
jgi:AraC-like DNA-binding protein